MAGQIINRGERIFLVRVFLGRDDNGQRKYLNHTVHGTKKDAQAYLNQVLRDRDLGVFVEPSKRPLNEYLDEWLETAVKPRVRERTYDDYCSLLTRYIRPELGGRQLSQIGPMEIQKVYGQLIETGLSPRTVRYAHGVLRDALQQAVKWQLLQRNPAEFVDLPRHQRREMQVLSPEQVSLFLDASKSNPWHALFLTAVTTGMRPGEYLALQWKDINFATRTISVVRTVTPKGEFQEPKTSRSRRSIRLLPSVVQALRAHRIRQAEFRLKQGQVYDDKDLVFASETGNPLNERNLVNRHFKPLLKAAGLPDTLRLYDLRHTCATLLLAAGENPKVVSERLGHASVALTLDTYSHVLPDMQQAAADKLEALLSSPSGRQ